MSDSCESYARMLLHRLGHTALPVRPREVAQKMDISIKEVDAGDRYDGYLLKCNGSFGIMINSTIKYEARKNFTIAHEIGHAEIPHHKGQEYKCLSSNIGMLLGKDFEIEANEFASELLMPASFVSEQADKSKIGLDIIKFIADKCETSLTSSALRYIKYCPEIAVVVVSEDNKIKYFSVSEEMKERKLFLSSGTNLNRLSVAHDFFSNDGSVSSNNEDNQQVDISAWFPALDYSQYDCFENALALLSFNQVISLVWLVEKYDDEEE